MRHRYVLLALVLPVVGACSSNDNAGTASTPQVTAALSATTSVPASTDEAAVGIADFKFMPPDVEVPIGGSVVWTNNDKQPHTATSAGSFDAGAIQPGASATVAFRTAGTFTYICSFHPFMTGTVTVG